MVPCSLVVLGGVVVSGCVALGVLLMTGWLA
jgi:hypothetical protein